MCTDLRGEARASQATSPSSSVSAPAPVNLRVGLTGGIASGKSTVGRLLAERGCVVTDADQLVSELYEPHHPGAEAVAQLFGPHYLDQTGRVRREQLAATVFRDATARRSLEAAIHPLVAQRFMSLAAATPGIVVFEATLLVETGGYRGFEALVTVEAPEPLRERRAIDRGLSLAETQRRIAAQATRDQRTAVADFVVDNRGTLADLTVATEAVLEQLRERLRDKIAAEDS